MTVVDFCFSTCFRHLSTISVFFEFFETGYWARSFEKHLGSSGGVREGIWGRPGGSGGRPWGVLGASWVRLGASWGALGASWGVPGELLGRLGALLGRSFLKFNF